MSWCPPVNSLSYPEPLCMKTCICGSVSEYKGLDSNGLKGDSSIYKKKKKFSFIPPSIHKLKC